MLIDVRIILLIYLFDEIDVAIWSINIYNIFSKLINKQMFQHLSTQEDGSPKGKTIYVMQNGFPDCIFKMNFIKPITRSDIADAA